LPGPAVGDGVTAGWWVLAEGQYSELPSITLMNVNRGPAAPRKYGFSLALRSTSPLSCRQQKRVRIDSSIFAGSTSGRRAYVRARGFTVCWSRGCAGRCSRQVISLPGALNSFDGRLKAGPATVAVPSGPIVRWPIVRWPIVRWPIVA
jgi:hypothetical protein